MEDLYLNEEKERKKKEREREGGKDGGREREREGKRGRKERERESERGFLIWLSPKSRSNVSLEDFPLTLSKEINVSLLSVLNSTLFIARYYITQASTLPRKSYQLSSLPGSAGRSLSDQQCIFSTWHLVAPPDRFLSELDPVGIREEWTGSILCVLIWG